MGSGLGFRGAAGALNRPLSIKTELTVADLAEDATGKMVTHAGSGYWPVWIQSPPPSPARAVRPWTILPLNPGPHIHKMEIIILLISSVPIGK